MAEPRLNHSPDAYKEVRRHLLNLHGKAHEAELDGEGIQAWLEWEMEALLWGVPVEISEADLRDLVEASEVSLVRVDDAPGTQAVRSHHRRGVGSQEGVR